jgi:hypothetical protein
MSDPRKAFQHAVTTRNVAARFVAAKGAIPPQFLEHMKKKEDKGEDKKDDKKDDKKPDFLKDK